MAECVSNKNSVITVDPDSDKPSKLWFSICKTETVKKVNPKVLQSQSQDNHLRFVCISDTHARMEQHPGYVIPDGDVLLHAGDFTDIGLPHQVEKFNEYLGDFHLFILCVEKFICNCIKVN